MVKRRRHSPIRILTAPLRKLPDFLLIGVNSGGTTSFFGNLIKHPQIARPSLKEPHFLDTNHTKPKLWYQSYFAYKWDKRIAGEATPRYIFHPMAAQHAQRLVPNAKIIVLLRNPIDRAYSQHQKHLRLGLYKVSPFAEMVERELDFIQAYPTYEEIFTTGFETHRNTLRSRQTLYLLRGLYADQLTLWLAHFKREQFLFLKSEDYFAQPLATIEQLAETFLGLAPYTIPDYEKSPNQGKTYPEGKLDIKMRQKLQAFYEPYNQALYDLIGRDMAWH